MTDIPFVDEILLATEHLPPGWTREAVSTIPAYHAGIEVLDDVAYHYYQALRWESIHTVADLLAITQEKLRQILGEYDPLPLLLSLRKFLQSNPPPPIFDIPLSDTCYPYGSPLNSRLLKRWEMRNKQNSPPEIPLLKSLPPVTELPPGWPIAFVRRVPAYQFGIDILGLPTRFYRALKRAQIRTIADLLSFTADDLVDYVYQFSQKGLDYLQPSLSEFLSATPMPWRD
jgi:hypothetical protein